MLKKTSQTPKSLSVRDMTICYEGNPQKVKKIVEEKGANAVFLAETTDDQGNVRPYNITLLSCACLVADTDIVDFLLKNGAELEIVNQDGKTPLIATCSDFRTFDRKDMPNGSVRRLLNARGNPVEFIKDRTTVADMLIKKGANIHAVTPSKAQTIHFACAHGFHDILTLLLDNGADINALMDSGITPLHMACLHQPLYIDIVRTLLQRGADRTIRDTSEPPRTAQQHLEALSSYRDISSEHRTQIENALQLFVVGTLTYIPPPQSPNSQAAEEMPQAPSRDLRRADTRTLLLALGDVYHNAMAMLTYFTTQLESSRTRELTVFVSELGIFKKTLFFIIQNIIPQLTTQTTREELDQYIRELPSRELDKCGFILNNKDLIDELIRDNSRFVDYTTLAISETSTTIIANNMELHEKILRDSRLGPLYHASRLFGGSKRKRKRKATLKYSKKGKNKSKRK